MSDCVTNFPPQTYSSSFYLNALTEDDKTLLVSNSMVEIGDVDDVHVQAEKNSPILDCFISTMHHFYIILLSILHTCATQSTTQHPSTSVKPPEAKICITETVRRIRTFPNLLDYQANQKSFDPRDPSYEGNIVAFDFDTIYSLDTNDFISHGQEYIIEMDLHHKEIKSINVAAFSGLTCLSKLDLSCNNLSSLLEGSFKGLENLKQLNLSRNFLEDIPDNNMAFFLLESLEVLDLSYNAIKSITKLSFITLSKLEYLNLGYNKIKTIDGRAFNSLNSLKELRLNDNLLVDAGANQWKGLNNLTTLDLGGNYLISFDASANYSFYNLKRLNLSGNHLQYLNVHMLRRNFLELKSLDLANNNWFCEDLIPIKHELIDSRIVIPREVSCTEIKTTSVRTSTTSLTTPAPEVPKVLVPDDDKIVGPQNSGYGEEVLKQNEKIIQSNNDIIATLGSLKSWVIFAIIVLIVGVVAEIGSRRGWFDGWNGFSARNNREYLDSNDVESVGLIRR